MRPSRAMMDACRRHIWMGYGGYISLRVAAGGARPDLHGAGVQRRKRPHSPAEFGRDLRGDSRSCYLEYCSRQRELHRSPRLRTCTRSSIAWAADISYRKLANLKPIVMGICGGHARVRPA